MLRRAHPGRRVLPPRLGRTAALALAALLLAGGFPAGAQDVTLPQGSFIPQWLPQADTP